MVSQATSNGAEWHHDAKLSGQIDKCRLFFIFKSKPIMNFLNNFQSWAFPETYFRIILQIQDIRIRQLSLGTKFPLINSIRVEKVEMAEDRNSFEVRIFNKKLIFKNVLLFCIFRRSSSFWTSTTRAVSRPLSMYRPSSTETCVSLLKWALFQFSKISRF